MTDTELAPWMEDFIGGLRLGKPPTYLARVIAGMPLAAVQELRKSNPTFGQMWEAVLPSEDTEAPVRELTGAALEALLWAQCTDEATAAYFGLSVDAFMDTVKGSPSLQRVYDTAREGGKAALQRAQWEAAMEGDRGMLTWLGKQHLGQADKVDHKGVPAPVTGAPVTINQIILRTLTSEQLDALAAAAEGIGEHLVLEGSAEVVDG